MNPIDQVNAQIRMSQAQDELLERLAQGECFLDAVDDAARIARLSEAEKQELVDYGLSI